MAESYLASSGPWISATLPRHRYGGRLNSPFEALDSHENDDRMRSLIEASRETGIPMPVILRLQREHPQELPSVKMGAAHFFPEGVLPKLKALAEADGIAAGSAQSRAHGLISLSRRRRDLKQRGRVTPGGAPTPPSRPSPGAPAEPVPPVPSSTDAPPPSAKAPTASAEAGAALAAQLEVLEDRQRRLVQELDDLLLQLQRPSVATFPTT